MPIPINSEKSLTQMCEEGVEGFLEELPEEFHMAILKKKN